ncbi:fluoride efflux transporter CrcB [Methanolobus profundi]|uniref:Fluoride-specific ion channel FluC n=1 Tax=Methanolobus profundi TaxID=487685 RepID=A0A1I4QX94_9EURY|nr:fluoride efflux transporter CrcB [Methanolobus profundi]SFM44316.1 camphor resistance protein CrcB [Methanolobus profundi]
MVSEIMLVGIGGSIGAILRYLVSGAIPKVNGIPAGTLAVNSIGSFILAAFTFTSVEGTLRFFISVGMLGSFTTFSTFAFESFKLLEEGESRYFLLNIALNVVVCLCAAALAHLIFVPY